MNTTIQEILSTLVVLAENDSSEEFPNGTLPRECPLELSRAEKVMLFLPHISLGSAAVFLNFRVVRHLRASATGHRYILQAELWQSLNGATRHHFLFAAHNTSAVATVHQGTIFSLPRTILATIVQVRSGY